MKPVACLVFLLAACSCATFCPAQPKTETIPGKENLFDSTASQWKVRGGANPEFAFYKTKMGKPFGLTGTYKTVDGKTIDFSRLQHPTFVCFGFYGCHPCMHELPVFIECSPQYPDIDFVYITYDKELYRRKELAEIGKKNFKPGPNYYIIEMHDEDIYKSGLTWGYPTKYFIRTDGIVRYVHSGGNTSEPAEAIKNRVAQIINEL